MQYNINVANGTGMEVRTNLNLAHQSLATNFFGATDPSLMSPVCAFPGSTWADTGNGLLKVRNADDSDWIVIGTIKSDGTPKLGENAINTSELALNLRQPSTKYAVGDIAYSALLPSWAVLRCITAGTTGSGNLPVPSTVTEYGKITDGTVVWQIQKLADKLDTTGGTMTGNIAISTNGGICSAVNNSYIFLNGGTLKQSTTGYFNGAYLILYGKDYNDPLTGVVRLAANNGSQQCELKLAPSGAASWKGIPLESLGMPSSTAVNIPFQVTSTWTQQTYIAPADGYIFINISSVTGLTYSIGSVGYSVSGTNTGNMTNLIPVSKGNVDIILYYTGSGSPKVTLRFFYAKGAL